MIRTSLVTIFCLLLSLNAHADNVHKTFERDTEYYVEDLYSSVAGLFFINRMFVSEYEDDGKLVHIVGCASNAKQMVFDREKVKAMLESFVEWHVVNKQYKSPVRKPLKGFESHVEFWALDNSDQPPTRVTSYLEISHPDPELGHKYFSCSMELREEKYFFTDSSISTQEMNGFLSDSLIDDLYELSVKKVESKHLKRKQFLSDDPFK